MIMGTYNPSNKIFKSVESILNQSYTNFEFIIYNDGSTNPQSQSYIQQIAKLSNKIVLIQSEQNQGLAYALNQCIKAANTDILIRMDDDDISHPNRIEKLVSYASKYPEMAVIGTWTTLRSTSTKEWGVNRPPANPVLKDVFKGNAFAHASALLQRKALKDVDYYSVDASCNRLEDYDLWLKLYLKGYKGINIKEYLYHILEDLKSVRKRSTKFRLNEFRLKYKYSCSINLPLLLKIRVVLKPLVLILIPLRLYLRIRKLIRRK